LNFLALLGWSMPDGREIFSLDDFIQAFSFEQFVTTGPVFAMDKLDSINGQYIRSMSRDQLLTRLFERDYVRAQLPLVQELMRTLHEFPTAPAFFFEAELDYEAAALAPRKAEPPAVVAWLKGVRERIQEFRPFTAGPLEEVLRAYVTENELNTGQVFMAIRV